MIICTFKTYSNIPLALVWGIDTCLLDCIPFWLQKWLLVANYSEYDLHAFHLSWFHARTVEIDSDSQIHHLLTSLPLLLWQILFGTCHCQLRCPQSESLTHLTRHFCICTVPPVFDRISGVVCFNLFFSFIWTRESGGRCFSKRSAGEVSELGGCSLLTFMKVLLYAKCESAINAVKSNGKQPQLNSTVACLKNIEWTEKYIRSPVLYCIPIYINGNLLWDKRG